MTQMGSAGPVDTATTISYLQAMIICMSTHEWSQSWSVHNMMGVKLSHQNKKSVYLLSLCILHNIDQARIYSSLEVVDHMHIQLQHTSLFLKVNAFSP